MQGPAFVAGLHQAGHAAFVIAGARLHLGFAQHPRHGFARDAVVDHIDHATHSTAAIKQGGGAAQNFNAVGRQHIQRHSVVVAQGRSIQAGCAVVQHPDAVTVQAPNDGAAGVGAKVGAGHARQAVEGFAQSALPAFQQIVAPHGTDRHRGLVAPQRVAGDDDFGGHTGGHRLRKCRSLRKRNCGQASARQSRMLKRMCHEHLVEKNKNRLGPSVKH